jgi:phosphate transport system substrate-binding protein
MRKPSYFWRALFNVFVLLPLLFQVLAIGVGILGASMRIGGDPSWGMVAAGIPVGALFLWHCTRSGRRDIRTAALREQTQAEAESAGTSSPARLGTDPSFLLRYLPVLLPAAFTLLVSLIVLLRPAPGEDALFGPFAATFTVTHLPACLVLSFAYLFGVPSPWLYLLPTLAIYCAYGLGIRLGFRDLGGVRTAPAGRILSQATLLIILAIVVWRIEEMQTGFVSGNGRQERHAENTFNARHRPFDPNNVLPKVSAPSLQIDQAHPTLDGATALYPVYAAAAQALYKNFDTTNTWRHIRTSTTPKAYERLISGEVDLVFVAQPSVAQRTAAEAAGRPLKLVPIAKEAFVFFVHADNPVDALTSEQIRGIYTKRIVNWKEVGGRDEKILAFQRPEGSGSQTALELKVMPGEKPATPLREEFASGMGGVIQQVAAYKNSREAIGYSFRVFATAMNPEGTIKLLKVDGVAPTREAIRSGAYPYTVELYAATAGTTNPQVPGFLDWLLSPQGQDLIDQTGYVSLRAAVP